MNYRFLNLPLKPLLGASPLDIALITAVCTLTLTPVLISPHWGLFSDAAQILSFPKSFIERFPGSISSLGPGDSRWNPLFHGLTVAIYWCFGESARAFYIVQGLMLVTSLVLVFSLSVAATSSRIAGYAATMLVLLGAPIFENFLTLDKVEPRVGLFSIVAFFWLMKGLTGENHQKTALSIWTFFLGQIGLGILSVFSKETGLFLLPTSIAIFWLTSRRKSRSQFEVSWAGAFMTAQLVTFLTFVSLYFFLLPVEGTTFRYVTYQLNLWLLANNAFYYLKQMPEIAFSIIAFFCWLVWKAKTHSLTSLNDREILLFAAGIAGTVYLLGLLLWRWRLTYYPYPAYLFLSISLVGVVAALHRTHADRKSFKVLVLILCGMILSRIPARFYDGQAIYVQDKSKDLAVDLIVGAASQCERLAVALFHPENGEIGERFEYFVKRQGKTIQVFNMVEGPKTKRHDLTRYAGSAGSPPSVKQLAEASKVPSAYILWREGSPTSQGCPGEPEQSGDVWSFSPLRMGDWLLIPVGSTENKRVAGRGVGHHSRDASDYVKTYFPGITVEPIGDVSVRWSFFRQFYLGWQVSEVISIGHTFGVENE